MSSIREILTEVNSQFRELYGPQLLDLRLFGSQARGDADPDSDIDLLVVLRDNVNQGSEIKRTGGIVAELSLKHDTVISCVFVSQNAYATEANPFFLNIRREAIAV